MHYLTYFLIHTVQFMQLGKKQAVDENQIPLLSWDFYGKLIMKLKEINPCTWIGQLIYKEPDS